MKSYASEVNNVPFLASADLGWWLGHSILVAGRYAGTSAIAHGDSLPARTQHRLGACVLFRVDDHLDLVAGGWSTVASKNVLAGNQFYVALNFKNTKLDRLQGFLGGTKAP